MVPWHPDCHVSATSPSLLRDDPNLRNTRMIIQWRCAGRRASPYRHPGWHANVAPPGLRSRPSRSTRHKSIYMKFVMPFSWQPSPVFPPMNAPQKVAKLKSCILWSCQPCQPATGVLSQERRRHINLRKILTGRASLGHTAGQTGVYRPVFQGFPVVYFRRTDRKGQFCQDTGRVSRGHPAIQRVFVIFMWFFLMCHFCSLLRAFQTQSVPGSFLHGVSKMGVSRRVSHSSLANKECHSKTWSVKSCHLLDMRPKIASRKS